MAQIQTTPIHWRDMSFKDKAAVMTALISFALGFILLFLGFVVEPTGEISASVLTGFGTALLYTAGAFGIVMYVKTSQTELYSNMMDHINKVIETKLKNEE